MESSGRLLWKPKSTSKPEKLTTQQGASFMENFGSTTAKSG